MYYFQNHPSPFNCPNAKDPPPKKKSKLDKILVSDMDLALCCFNLIQSAPGYFKNLWDWSTFITRFQKHVNPEVRWIVCQCLAMLGGLSEQEKLSLVSQSLTTEENRLFSLKHLAKFDSLPDESASQISSRPVNKSLI